MSTGRFKLGVHAHLKLILPSVAEFPLVVESYLRVSKILQYIEKNESFSLGVQRASLENKSSRKIVGNNYLLIHCDLAKPSHVSK